ncbi:MAG: hypothetical protein RDV48_25245 [Candidatus Eremiobacteraeota bacterium]|nr:hypothetical protein [Candidatus Eremiobacteraeota bacterium]
MFSRGERAVSAVLLIALWAGLFLVLGALPAMEAHPTGEAIAGGELTEADRDSLGCWKKSRSYGLCSRAGVRIVDFPDKGSFAAFWTPRPFKSGRVMVLLHGTGGTAYEEIKDELSSARSHGYMLISLNWLDPRSGRYLDASSVYGLIHRALHHAASKHGANPDRAALCGFSRGGAVSYEVAWRDAQENRHFRLVICHSGGVPADAVVTPRSSRDVDSFFSRLNRGELPPDSYHGCPFFLYSGDRDEEWGAAMSGQMAHACKVLPRAGARVVEWMRDPEGGHMGYRTSTKIHDEGIGWFLRLTEK